MFSQGWVGGLRLRNGACMCQDRRARALSTQRSTTTLMTSACMRLLEQAFTPTMLPQASIWAREEPKRVCVCVCAHVYMYVCMCVHMRGCIIHDSRTLQICLNTLFLRARAHAQCPRPLPLLRSHCPPVGVARTETQQRVRYPCGPGLSPEGAWVGWQDFNQSVGVAIRAIVKHCSHACGSLRCQNPLPAHSDFRRAACGRKTG